jgi:hypothetical protein
MHRGFIVLTIAVIAGVAPPSRALAQSSFDPARDTVAAILRAPATDGGGYTRFILPRSDLTVMVGDVKVEPALALGSWAGFTGTPAAAEAMGDIIATDAELPIVLNAFVSARLDVTAIHDHLNDEAPRLTYLHFHGSGGAIDLANRVNSVISATAAPRPGVHPTTSPAAVTIDTAEVFRVLGQHGHAAGSVVSMSFNVVGGPVLIAGKPVVAAMAYATPIAIQQVTPSRAWRERCSRCFAS